MSGSRPRWSYAVSFATLTIAGGESKQFHNLMLTQAMTKDMFITRTPTHQANTSLSQPINDILGFLECFGILCKHLATCSRPHAPSHMWDVRIISSYTWRPIVQHAWPGWAAPAASSQCILRRGWPRCGWPPGKTRLRYSQSRCSMFCAASRHIFCM